MSTAATGTTTTIEPVPWWAWGLLFLIVAGLALWHYGSVSGSAKTAAAPGVYQQLTVGEEEVEVNLPLNSWWDVDADKPVIVRLRNGQKFECRPDGSTYKVGADGSLTPVDKIGRAPGAVIFIAAKKGEKMVRTKILATRKSPT